MDVVQLLKLKLAKKKKFEIHGMSCNKKKMLIFVWTRFSTQKSDPNERDLTKKCVFFLHRIACRFELNRKQKQNDRQIQWIRVLWCWTSWEWQAGGRKKFWENNLCAFFFCFRRGLCVAKFEQNVKACCVEIKWILCNSYMIQLQVVSAFFSF